MFKPLFLSLVLTVANFAPDCQAAFPAAQTAVFQPIEPKKISKKKLKTIHHNQSRPSWSAAPIEPQKLTQSFGSLWKEYAFAISIGLTMLLLLVFLAGLSLYAVGFLQGISFLVSWGLGLEIGSFLLSVCLAIVPMRAKDPNIDVLSLAVALIIVGGLGLLLKGSLLVALGLVLGSILWIPGAIILSMGLVFAIRMAVLFAD